MVDVETSPNLVHVWGLFNQDVAISKIVAPTEVICFAAKWYKERGVEFHSVHHDGRKAMIKAAHRLFDEADVVLGYNSQGFDTLHLNREFLTAGLKPPSPYKQIDLYLAVKRRFNFPSNKLAYVSKALGLKGKVETGGFDLWLQCMAGNDDAWAKMKRYNIRDVTLLEELYDVLQPWIPSHPSYAAMTGEHICPACGSTDLIKRGYTYTQVSAYVRYVCKRCGKYSRATHREQAAPIVEVAS
jgi:predicted RNA-binding Zn-ribbon protein involved in translation (DUF1610 family)